MSLRSTVQAFLSSVLEQRFGEALCIADRVAAAGIEPMSMEEINAKVKAARVERRQRAGGH